ncbi:MAG TPA: helix-turn-helix domain-containing protein [Halanaerobiales bacterium]|nr:helix-turn-helix domain-containing protein [Halanaerobiales bacterium]
MNEKTAEIEKVLTIYSSTTGINCRAIRVKDMDFLRCAEGELTPDFCHTVCNYPDSRVDCHNAYLYAARQAEKLGDAYIYFCPYGLVNWSVPVLNDKKMEFFLVGGPTLIHPVDDLLLEDIFKQNPLLKKEEKTIRRKLEEIPYADPVKTRYLAELLMCLSESYQNTASLIERRKKDSINAYLNESIQELKEKEKRADKGEINSERYPIELERELISEVRAGNKEKASRLLNSLLGYIYFKHGDFVIIRAKTIELMAVLARAAIEIGADLQIIFGLEYMLYDKLRQVEDLNQLSEYLSEILERFIESTFVIRKAQNSDIIFKAMNYIRNNYYKQDINLNEVAGEVGLSVSYFSKLFKEETGLSYSEYLNKVRLAAAKELLNKDISIAETAYTVGFNDQSYFSRVFKKSEGISPGKYKRG